MDEVYKENAKTFVQFCLQCALYGFLNLSDEEYFLLYSEVLIVAFYVDDADTKMLVYNQLGLLCMKLQLYDRAVLYQQFYLIFANDTKNKVAQINAYRNLGNAYCTVNKPGDALSCYLKEKEIATEIEDNNRDQGDYYGRLGNVYASLGQHDNAIEMFKQLLLVAIETDNERHQKVAYCNMAVAYKKMNDNGQVIRCYEKLLEITSEEDEQVKKGVYFVLGGWYLELNNFHKAIEYLEKSLEVAKRLQDQRLELEAYEIVGSCYIKQGNFLKASDYYEKELKLAIKLDDKNYQAGAYRNLGVVYKNIGNYTKAMEYHERSLRIALSTSNKTLEASAYGNIGNVYQRLSDYHKAIKYHELELKLFIDIGSKPAQAVAYGNLGIAYKSLGNYYETIGYQTKNLEICVEIGDKMGEARARGNLGVAHELLGQYHEAIAQNEKSLEISRQIGYRYAEGRANGNLGMCHLNLLLISIEESMVYFKESLKIALEVNDRENEANAYGNLGKCKANLGQYDEALEFYDKQIRLAKDLGEKIKEGMGYGHMGSLHYKLGDHQKAIYFFEKSLKIVKETDNKGVEASIHSQFGTLYGSIAMLHKKNGEQEKYHHCIVKAIQYLKEGLTCREWLFDHLKEHDHFKISILDTFIKDYNFLTVFLMMNNEHKEALLVSERGRARALDDLLVRKYNINRDSQSGSHCISYAAIENMASDCSILFYSLNDLCISWVIYPDNPSVLQLSTDEVGFSGIVKSAYETLKVREFQCEDQSIQTDEHKQKPNLSVPKTSRIMDESEKLLLSAYEMIKERCIWDEDLYDVDNPSPLEVLYKALISPVLHMLTKDEIVIIPDGALFTVPFAALRDPNTGEFLSETKRIRLAPSLTSLKMLHESPADFHSKTGALIIGNPKVGKVMFKGKTKEISDLPFAEEEARMLGNLLVVNPFIGSQATKETIIRKLREGVAIVHFAAHGTTDGEVFLAPSTTGDLPSEQDYLLTMKEVQESGVRPQLVVLSCCHSGRGEIKAEGVVGMSRAFLAAGARAVVASLWAIADEATMVFIEKFYTHLKQGESASKSLQAAMKDMREIPRYSDPQFWAPFFIVGADVTIRMWDK